MHRFADIFWTYMDSLSSNCGKCTGKQIRCGFAFEKSNLMFPKSLLVRPGLATYVVTAFIVHNLRLGNVVIKYKNYKIKGKLNSFWKSTKVFVIKSFDFCWRGALLDHDWKHPTLSNTLTEEL